MKWLIILLLITMATSAGDPADALENKYVNGLDIYKVEYDARCRTLSLSYIAKLEKLQVATVKKGDLDGALKIRKRIEATKKMLDTHLPMQIPRSTTNKSTIKWTKITFAGTTWECFSGKEVSIGHLTFLPGGKIKGKLAGRDKSRWKWDFRNGKVYLGDNEEGIIIFSEDGYSYTSGSPTGVKYPGFSRLVK